MASAVWKIPRDWRPSLVARTALYPALYLRSAGHEAAISPRSSLDAWSGAELRVLVADGPLGEDDRELMSRAAERGLPMLLAPQAGLSQADRAFAAGTGCAIAAWRDPGPLATASPHRPGAPLVEFTGLPARLAEERSLSTELGLAQGPAGAERPRIVAIAESTRALQAVLPAIRRRLAMGDAEFLAIGQDQAVDSDLLGLFQNAEAVLCIHSDAAPDDPRPAQWVRTALFAGAPVIAASHPSLDGLAHLCTLDDWERGLELHARLPVQRLKAAASAQAEIAARIDPDAIASEWLAAARLPASQAQVPRPLPTLLALIDIHQDLDVLLPVLLALKARGEAQLRLVLSDYLLADSPRIAAALGAHGLEFTTHPREAIRSGAEPALAGADGALSGADTIARAHKAGHTLLTRAKAEGLPTFTLQHGLENIGLTYRDHLHGEEIRFAAERIFIWGPREGLAPWVAAETRDKVVPVGSPKAAPLPAAAMDLRQGHWARVVGVFENLHWHRFSELYLERALEDLAAAAEARPDTLFLIKPHHAGRWLSRNPGRLAPRPNLVVIDPTDSAWEPHTAPDLIASVDAVLTTPSTVALDAARSGRPVAVLGYDLELPLYDPLPVVRGLHDLDTFLGMSPEDALARNESFLDRTVLPGRADHRIAAAIALAMSQAQPAAAPRKPWLSA